MVGWVLKEHFYDFDGTRANQSFYKYDNSAEKYFPQL